MYIIGLPLSWSLLMCFGLIIIWAFIHLLQRVIKDIDDILKKIIFIERIIYYE